jgi:hypothetical protein
MNVNRIIAVFFLISIFLLLSAVTTMGQEYVVNTDRAANRMDMYRSVDFRAEKYEGIYVPFPLVFRYIDVKSNPTGAEVIVDGKYINDAPARATDLTADSHKIQCLLPGYLDFETTAYAYEDKSNDVTCTLTQRQPAPSASAPYDLSGRWSMVADTNYKFDLDLTQDGDKLSGTMRRTNGNEPVDTIRGVVYSDGRVEFHRLRPGSWVQKYTGLSSNPSGTLHLEGSFETTGSTGEYNWVADISSRDTGSVSIDSKPSGAEISVDGTIKGKTPAEILEYPGSHEVVLNLSGFYDCSKTVSVKAGSGVSVSCNLEPSLGSIIVRSNPPGAEILIDGKSLGKADPGLNVSNLEPGSYKVLFKLAGYSDIEALANVTAGETTEVVGNLTRSQGSISVISIPPGADVLINGETKGSTPMTILELAPGPYRVGCRLPGYNDFERNVTVNAGATTPLNCTLVSAGESSIIVSPEPTSVKVGQPSEITVTLTGPDSSPLEGEEVEIASPRGGLFTQSTGKTDSQGRFSSNFTPNSEGEFDVVATFNDRGEMVEGKTTVEVTGAADTIFLALLALIGVAGYLGARRRD